MTASEREETIDLMMNGIKRIALILQSAHVCPACSLNMQLMGILMFHKDMGHVSAEEAIDVMMHSYNRVYAGEASIIEEIPEGVKH